MSGRPESVKRQVRARFGRAAPGYVTSAGHAQGDDLGRMVELARLGGDERVLDVATGGGHTALAFARRAREVVASDLTPAMLAAAEEFIGAQGVDNVRFQIADAEAMPFDDAEFDVVTARIAPHHFPRPQRFVEEVARVLKPGTGRFLLDDNMAPEDPELDAFMNRFEKWRDPGHVRAWSVPEWVGWIEGAGMSVEHVEPLAHKRHAFGEWTDRMSMPEAEREALEAWLLSAAARCADFFNLTVEAGRVTSIDGCFAILVASRS